MKFLEWLQKIGESVVETEEVEIDIEIDADEPLWYQDWQAGEYTDEEMIG